MKLKISQAHLESNRRNAKLYGHLGGASYAKKMAELKIIKVAEYNKNPKLCKHCQNPIPYDKKVNNFCSRSCSCSYNNIIKSYDSVKETWAKKPKSIKRPAIKKNRSGHIIEPNAPYSTIFNCNCQHCKTKFINRIQKRYCSNCENLYSHDGRAKFWFTFNVFHYPDLFDLSLINTYGFRDNKTNPNGITRDHKISVNDAIRYGYDPYYIKHPMNWELMFFNENNKKKTNSSITYQELIKLVDDYDKK
jgi:hypothetical protein